MIYFRTVSIPGVNWSDESRFGVVLDRERGGEVTVYVTRYRLEAEQVAEQLNRAPGGQDAMRGNVVLNIYTGKMGRVTGTTQNGRLLVGGFAVNSETGKPLTVDKWERWSCIVTPFR